MANLVVIQGPDKGRTFRTQEGSTLLGREGEQIPLTDRTVSRQHAELRPDNGVWVLHDLRSANGTYVNGIRVRQPIRLKHGDQIRIGATLMVYTGDQAMGDSDRTLTARELVNLDASNPNLDSAIISAISGDESIVIAGPEITEAARAWKVMSELTAAIGAIMDPAQLLERVMDVIRDELPVDHGFILMYDKEGENLTPHVVRYRPGTGKREGITTSRRIINHVVQRREAILCSNAMTDARFATEAVEDSIHDFGLRSVICAPILVRDQVLGVIHIDSAAAAHTYTHEQLRLMSSIGQMTGLAIQNARLVQQQMQTARLAATGETVAYLSHNIKNVLQAMQAGADLVDLGVKNEDLATLSKGWEIVKRNLAHIMQMTMNMLNFSKTREPNLKPDNLNTIVAEAVAGLEKKASERQIKLITDLEEPFPPIPLDAEGMSQVALNLIDNAICAVMPSTGIVRVFTRFNSEEGIADLIVSDNGPGMDPDRVEEMFEPFMSTKGNAGTGLGLPVTRKIVREHHGRTIVDTQPGEGTTFQIRLPAQERLRASEETYSTLE